MATHNIKLNPVYKDEFLKSIAEFVKTYVPQAEKKKATVQQIIENNQLQELTFLLLNSTFTKNQLLGLQNVINFPFSMKSSSRKPELINLILKFVEEQYYKNFKPQIGCYYRFQENLLLVLDQDQNERTSWKVNLVIHRGQPVFFQPVWTQYSPGWMLQENPK